MSDRTIQLSPVTELVDTASVEEVFTLDELATRVHGTLPKKSQKEISLERVQETLSGIDLSRTKWNRTAPRLWVNHLSFEGIGKDGQPIHYEQKFASGINIVLIPDNGAGKTTILKTIKLALTGDDEYDNDVRGWIHRIWLQFSIDTTPFTVHLSRGEGGFHGYLSGGHVNVRMEGAPRLPLLLGLMHSAEEYSANLQQFFFRRFEMSSLSWTEASDGGRTVRSTSWLTFLHALVIPGNSEGYLLIDPARAYGGQEGLILSMFLGLSYAEPLNDLLVKRKLAEADNQVSVEDRDQAQANIDALQKEIEAVQAEIKSIEAEQRKRQRQYEEAPTTQRLFDLRTEQVTTGEHLSQLEERHRELQREIQQSRARAQTLREGIALRLHFTGLEVALCPNCDHTVAEAEVQRERTEHLCRLCGKQAHAASAGELESMAASADELDALVERSSRVRDDITNEIRRVRSHAIALQEQLVGLERVLRQGIDYVLPTEEERERRSSLDRQIGAIRAKMSVADQVIARYKAGQDDALIRAKIHEKARGVLRNEADRLNEHGLAGFSALTEAMARRFGAESISEVSVSAVGALRLRKNGVQVSWGSIRNPGDRLRIKLAFFLAMMRLGRVEHAGRHPGFLMIDQPGSDEMVVEDFLAVAAALREIERDHEDELQVICFTARSEFADATVPGKIYGPKVGTKAF